MLGSWVRAPSGSHRNKARRRQKEKSPTISMYCGTFFMFPSYLKVPKGYEKKSWTSKQWYNWYSGYSASSASHTCAYVHYFITRTLFIYMRVSDRRDAVPTVPTVPITLTFTPLKFTFTRPNLTFAYVTSPLPDKAHGSNSRSACDSPPYGCRESPARLP